LEIEGRPYTIRLQPHCYYRGYIDGFPNSAVTLSTCSGLRGLLQFENVSYGIEPLGYSPAFEHFVYRVRDGKAAGSLLSSSRPEAGPVGLPAMEASSRKIVQVSSLLSTMFRSLNLTVTLSSVEVWMDNSMLKTTGGAEEVLMRLLQWKKSTGQDHWLCLWMRLCFRYRDQAASVGATAPGTACQRDAVGIFQKGVSLESFSALLAQLLGRSLGIGYDESPQCHCPGHVCIMSPEALNFNGAKAFSSCSIRDFQTFLKQNTDCPLMRQSQPQLFHHQDSCGNGVVEAGEQCDCGSMEECALDQCCTPQCLLKPGVECSSGLCCQNCQFKHKHWQCRPAADEQCDLAEFCTGASASCPPDLYVQDGHGCEQGTGYCYKGRCQSPDLQCQQIYGKGNGCSGITGANADTGINQMLCALIHCADCSRNLGCGKLVCVYPNRLPFTKLKGAIIYAHVQEHLCVSFDFMKGPTVFDPLMVKEGTKCGPGKVRNPMGSWNQDAFCPPWCMQVCNNNKNCHCDRGWSPPDCETTGPFVGGSIDNPWEAGGCCSRALGAPCSALLVNGLLLAFGILLSLFCSIIAVVRWRRQKGFFTRSEAKRTSRLQVGERQGNRFSIWEFPGERGKVQEELQEKGERGLARVVGKGKATGSGAEAGRPRSPDGGRNTETESNTDMEQSTEPEPEPSGAAEAGAGSPRSR
uniref:Uncharacterized protein n=1 Tax=Amazona collaria TaxID=241587 RepID=A0A8B9J359_9PSIT